MSRRRSRRGRGKRRMARMLRELSEAPGVQVVLQQPVKQADPVKPEPHKFGIFTVLPEKHPGGFGDWQPWVDDPCQE
jgi:hypothetical protein